MSAESPLLIPMIVEALVVNDHVRAPKNQIGAFVRTRMQYNSIQDCENGQPFLSGNDANFTSLDNIPGVNIPSSQYYNGVYLKWRLPKAFTSGTQDNVLETTTYPLVPNRWMVIRYSGQLNARQTRSWIVESDYEYLDDEMQPIAPSPANISQDATLFVQPDKTDNVPVGVFIGRNVKLGSWAESGKSLRLTAIGPGDPAFAFYQPHCNNVFSFVDPLGTEDPSGTEDYQNLSYQVLGWFSSPTDDPLHSGAPAASINIQSGYSGTLRFTPTSDVECQWSSGTLADSNGQPLSIAGGSTGAMTERTYIYLDPAASKTELQITTTLDTAQAPGCAIIAAAMPLFVAQLEALGWSLASETDKTLTASWSLLVGTVNGVNWQTSELPGGGTPNEQAVPVSVAVGNTSIHALTALITSQAAAANETIDSELLEAFQLNLLDMLDRPDGSALLTEKLRASFFQRHQGGYGWIIVDAPDATTPVSAEELTKEAAWLATLNQKQQALDEGKVELASLQRQLYLLWWNYQRWPQKQSDGGTGGGTGGTGDGGTNGYGDGGTNGYGDGYELGNADADLPSGFTTQMDPTIDGTLASRVLQKQNDIKSLQSLVPSGSTPDALAQAIDNYALSQQLPNTRQLKRILRDPFYLPNNPVVLFSGSGSSGIVKAPDAIQCRFPSQLVTGFVFNSQNITASTSGITIPQPQLSGVSGVPWQVSLITDLVNEFYFLDPNNAAAIAQAINGNSKDVEDAIGASAIGTPPDSNIQSWSNWSQNPWHPLLLFWDGHYYPIEYASPDKPNWIFDGNQYTWNQKTASILPYMKLQGVSLLAPTASFNMEARIQQFLDSNPYLPEEEKKALNDLHDFVQTKDAWDLMSQQLDGFNEQLQLGTPGVFLAPPGGSRPTPSSLPSLIGTVGSYPPLVTSTSTQGQGATYNQFQPWRSGQFEFVNLALVDEWGQALWPFDSHTYTKEILYLPSDLSPVLVSNAVPLSVVQDQESALSATSPHATDSSASSAAVTSVSPSIYQAGAVASDTLTVTVRGTDFVNGALVTWDGAPVDTTVVDSTTLQASIPASFLFFPDTAQIGVTSGGAPSNTVPFTIVTGAGILAVNPTEVKAGSGDTILTVSGVGFEPESVVHWNGLPLATSVNSSEQLTATVPSSFLSTVADAWITASVGSTVLPTEPDPFFQLPPAMLQPAKLIFNMVSATDDSLDYGPGYPAANPIAGWVFPNHLDKSLMAYDPTGSLLGEMSVGVSTTGDRQVFWTPAPFRSNATLADLADGPHAIPHFGPFLQALSLKTPQTVDDFLAAFDETLWTILPTGAEFDQSLAMLIGRPLAMVRARLKFQLYGDPHSDPGLDKIFDPSDSSKLAPGGSPVTGYKFGIKLGNVAQLNDGLIGYFVDDKDDIEHTYDTCNIVTQSGARSDGYLAPIGISNNFLYQPMDGTTQTFVSMLVDPRAPVHATTAILPDVSVALPPDFIKDALARMNVTFRVNGVLTDQKLPDPEATETPSTILTPTPRTKTGAWSWIEQEDSGWVAHPTGPNGTTAQLTEVAPVLRRGLLQLDSPLDD